MDSLDKKSASGFLKHVFNFEDESKSEMSNIVQYSILSLFPIVLLNKSMQKYVPEADEKKGSLEVLAEIVIQVVYMFLGLLFIHRIITYIPTYSGVNYPEFNVIFIILAALMIVLSLQTKLGDKVGILVDRVNELWEGKSGDKKGASTKSGSGTVKVSQPISQGGGGGQINQSQSGYSDGTMLNQLPDMSQQQQQQQQMPNYNSMYKQQSTPLVDAATPSGGGGGGGGFDNFGIMAANEALGSGGGFGSAW
jgi:hypothetical protein